MAWLLLSVPVFAAEIVLNDTTTLRDATTRNLATGCDAGSCKWYNFGWQTNLIGHNTSTDACRQFIGFNITSLPADIDSFIYYFRVGGADLFPDLDESKPCSTGFYWVDESYGALTEGEGTPGVPGAYDAESPALTWKFRNYDSPIGGGSADSTNWQTYGGPILGYFCGPSDVDTTYGWDYIIVDTAGLYSIDLTTNVQAALDASDTDIWFLAVPFYNLLTPNVNVAHNGEFRKVLYSAEYSAYGTPWVDSAPYVRVVYPDELVKSQVIIIQ